MAYKVIILYRLYMPPYFLGTFTEYPCISVYQLPPNHSVTAGIPARNHRTDGNAGGGRQLLHPV